MEDLRLVFLCAHSSQFYSCFFPYLISYIQIWPLDHEKKRSRELRTNMKSILRAAFSISLNFSLQ